MRWHWLFKALAKPTVKLYAQEITIYMAGDILTAAYVPRSHVAGRRAKGAIALAKTGAFRN